MKKLLGLLLCVMLLTACVSATAAGKLSVAQENFHTVTGYSTSGYAYAKVENVGDKPIKVNAAVLEMYDAEGNVITSTDYMNANARYLQPGEYTYVSMYDVIAGVDNEVVPEDYMLTITGKSDSDRVSQRVPCETSFELGVKDDWWEHNYLYATVTNSTAEPLYDLNVVMALMDEKGNLLYMNENSLYQIAINPGSSVTFRNDIPTDFMEYFEKNGFVPANVDGIAYVEVEQE